MVHYRWHLPYLISQCSFCVSSLSLSLSLSLSHTHTQSLTHSLSLSHLLSFHVLTYSPYDPMGRTYDGPAVTDNGFWDTFRTGNYYTPHHPYPHHTIRYTWMVWAALVLWTCVCSTLCTPINNYPLHDLCTILLFSPFLYCMTWHDMAVNLCVLHIMHTH
jgi:hypothetical protein